MATTFEILESTAEALSSAGSLEGIQEIVRRSARRLCNADGATFILRKGEFCYYADEDAIAPLWKGRRFPMDKCISGWVMRKREVAVVEDIYKDDRIPIDAYRPTFVKSLVVVPIRTADPIGAIGSYWAIQRCPNVAEVRLLQRLADSTALAMEKLGLLDDRADRPR